MTPDLPRTTTLHPLQQPAWRHALAVMAVLGTVLPWVWNLKFFATGGSVAPDVFWPAALANALTTAITLDVYLAAVTFSLAVAADRPAGARRWWAVPLCFGVGLSSALPAYLWWRTRPGAASQPA